MKKKVFALLAVFVVLFTFQNVLAEDILQVSILLEANNKSMIKMTEVGSDNLPFTFQIENVTDFNVNLDSLTLRPSGLVSEFFPQGIGGYKFYFETLDESKGVIESREFSNTFDARGLDVTSVAFNIKYVPEIEYIRVKYNDKEKLLVDVGNELCNNDKVCEGFENYYSCSSDCAVNSEDGICITLNDGLCDSDCVYDADCVVEDSGSESGFVWIVSGIILLAIIIVVIVVISIRKK